MRRETRGANRKYTMLNLSPSVMIRFFGRRKFFSIETYFSELFNLIKSTENLSMRVTNLSKNS